MEVTYIYMTIINMAY